MWIASKLKLTPTDINQKCIPIICEDDINSNTLKMNIPKGNIIGMSAIATIKTKEGITIEAECIGKIYNKDDVDKNEWTIFGDAETTVTINKPDTVKLTCADIVNRIPDVINAKAGFLSTDELIEPSYKIKY